MLPLPRRGGPTPRRYRRCCQTRPSPQCSYGADREVGSAARDLIVSEASGWTPRSISIVVPVFNEEENVELLVLSIADAVRPLGLPFELVIVDDGSHDGTVRQLRALLSSIPELVLVCLRRNFGQTPALHPDKGGQRDAGLKWLTVGDYAQ